MELGEKIRETRLAAGLSQRQLCGDTITRNMLSLIENGSARPSMDTLQVLARRLNRPVSYFLGEDVLTTGNLTALRDAWSAFERLNPEEAWKCLRVYEEEPDPQFDREYRLLRCLCLLSLAEAAIRAQRRPYAENLLQQAEELEKDLRWVPGLRSRRVLLKSRLAPVSESEFPSRDEELLARAAGCLAAGKTKRAAALLEAVQDRGDRWHLLRARAAVELSDYSSALVCLRVIEKNGDPEVYELLERCCRELEDYKSAYYYACLRRGK